MTATEKIYAEDFLPEDLPLLLYRPVCNDPDEPYGAVGLLFDGDNALISGVERSDWYIDPATNRLGRYGWRMASSGRMMPDERITDSSTTEYSAYLTATSVSSTESLFSGI